MKVIVVPASTQAGKATIDALLRDINKPQVLAVYRDTSKAPATFAASSNFTIVKGGLDEGLHLDFADADTVFYVPPPTYDQQVDSGEHATRAANKVKAAVQNADKVERLVVLSALGAQHASGIGILKINHITDKILADAAPEVLIARPGWFQENWAEALETAKGGKSFFETHFTPENHKIAMVSLRDVGQIIAQKLLETSQPLPARPHVVSIHGPQSYSMLDLQDALEAVTGKKPMIEAIKVIDLLKFFQQKLPLNKAKEVAEMTEAINGGGLLAEEMANPGLDVVRGSTELVDTLRRLDSGEVAKVASGAF